MSSLTDLLEDRKLTAACYDEALDEFRKGEGHEWALRHVRNFDAVLTGLDELIATYGVRAYVGF